MRKTWLLFSVRDLSLGLRNPFYYVSLSFSCKGHDINVTLLTLKIAEHKIQDYYVIFKSVNNVFELYLFKLVLKSIAYMCEMYFCLSELLMLLFLRNCR